MIMSKLMRVRYLLCMSALVTCFGLSGQEVTLTEAVRTARSQSVEAMET